MLAGIELVRLFCLRVLHISVEDKLIETDEYLSQNAQLILLLSRLILKFLSQFVTKCRTIHTFEVKRC